MKFTILTRVAGGLLCAGAFANGVRAGSEQHEEYICTSGAERRIVTVVSQGDMCRVDYTKGGGTMTLWSAQHDAAYCTAKAALLITKLIKDDYSCKTDGPPA